MGPVGAGCHWAIGPMGPGGGGRVGRIAIGPLGLWALVAGGAHVGHAGNSFPWPYTPFGFQGTQPRRRYVLQPSLYLPHHLFMPKIGFRGKPTISRPRFCIT